MRIIRKREHRTIVRHLHVFDWEGAPGSGFAFDCDAEGRLLPEVSSTAVESYKACLTGVVDGKPVSDEGVQPRTHSYILPAVGLCEECGEEVELHGFTNTCCGCGADYNMSGQRLAPRSQWGWETEETAADILMADVYDPWDEPS